MAKKDTEQNTEQAAAENAPQPETTRDYVFNEETGIYGYTFEDGTKFKRGPVYPLTEAQAKTYAKKEVNGHQLLVLDKRQ
jgi:phage tail tube protein FII